MRQRIDLGALYADALEQSRAGDRRKNIPRPWPETNLFTLDRLLNEDPDELLRHLPAANPP